MHYHQQHLKSSLALLKECFFKTKVTVLLSKILRKVPNVISVTYTENIFKQEIILFNYFVLNNKLQKVFKNHA